MGSKRAATGDDNEKPAKRHREHASSKQRKSGGSMVDPTYGQRGVFGDLRGATTVPTGDSDLECEDDADAMAYLRSVRTQASSIPHVVAAKKAGPPLPPQIPNGLDGEAGTDSSIDRSIYRDGLGDFRGYYRDGAYTAYPENYFDEDEEEEEEEEDVDYEDGEEGEGAPDYNGYDEEYSPDSSEDGPHNSSADEIRDAYFTSLINQYLSLRKILQTEPPEAVVRALPISNLIEVEHFGSPHKPFLQWMGRLKSTDPLPAQVAAMHKDSVVRLLRIILSGKFLWKNRELCERTSRWIWALLARLPAKGELDYQDVGLVRELGKRAVLLLVSLAEFEVLKENYEVGGGSSHGSQEEVEMDVIESFDEEISQGTPRDDDEIEPRDRTPTELESVALEAKGHAEPPASKTEPEEASDVEMQVESDDEEGEVFDTLPVQPPRTEAEETAADDIEAAKARLLAQLATNTDDNNNDNDDDDDGLKGNREQVKEIKMGAVQLETHRPHVVDEEKNQDGGDEDEHKSEEAARKAKVNERATLNMILTVAGEFYGQRDLLEFRDPFGSF